MPSKVYKGRLVLSHNLGGRGPPRLPPDEIHLGVNGAQRESRSENQQDAAVKKEARASETEEHRDHVVTLVSRERNDTNRDARRHEHSEAQIENHHTSLKNTRPAGQLVELLKNQCLSLDQRWTSFFVVPHIFQTIGEVSHPIHYAAETRRRRQNHTAAG